MVLENNAPIGAIDELQGSATITRGDGSTIEAEIGAPLYKGDIVETTADGAVNIVFIDETNMALSEGARFAVNDYSFDEATESGTTEFSVLNGVFVFTSGLIGRDDPDDVKIETPVGSIGIRGTIIAGNINPDGNSKITVVEGAIVVQNQTGEQTLSQQFETVELAGINYPIEQLGIIDPSAVTANYGSASYVIPSFFSNINEVQAEREAGGTDEAEQAEEAVLETTTDQVQEEAQEAPAEEPVEAEAVNEGEADLGEVLETLPDFMSGDETSAEEGLGTTTASNTATQAAQTTGTSNTLDSIGVASEVTTQIDPSLLNTGTNFSISTTTRNFRLTEESQAGDVVGLLNSNNPDLNFTFENGSTTSTDGFFEIVSGNVVLTATGEAAVDAHVANMFTAINSFNNTNYVFTTPAGLMNENIITTNQKGETNTLLFDANLFDFKQDLSGSGSATEWRDGFINVGLFNNPDNPNRLQTEVGINNFDDFVKIDANGSLIIQNLFDTTAGYNLGGPSDQRVSINTFDVDGVNNTVSRNYNFTTVSSIGDFNNDGSTDILAGASGASSRSDVGVNKEGGAILTIFGGNETSTTQSGSYLNYIQRAHDATEIASGDLYGHAIAGNMDYNGDGQLDYAVSAPGSDELGTNRGAVYLLDKNISGFRETDATKGTINDFQKIKTTIDNFELGHLLDNAGDTNGDGLSDLIIGGKAQNEAYIVFGDATPAANFNVSTMSGAEGITITVPNAYKIINAAGLGDFNGDGYDDFGISMVRDTAVAEDAVTTYIIAGKAGLTNIGISDLENPNVAYKIQHFGSYVDDESYTLRLVDRNVDDGFDDIAIGSAAGGDNFFSLSGKHFGTSDFRTDGVATANDQALRNSASMDDAGFDGISFIGDTQANTMSVSDINFNKVDGGFGPETDTLRYNGNGSLDFTDVTFEQIEGIERIEFGQDGGTITLTADNIFNFLKTSDDATLTIDLGGGVTVGNLTIEDGDEFSIDNYADTFDQVGDALHDSTSIDLSGASGDPILSNGYQEYAIGGYTLYIDADINIAVN